MKLIGMVKLEFSTPAPGDPDGTPLDVVEMARFFHEAMEERFNGKGCKVVATTLEEVP